MEERSTLHALTDVVCILWLLPFADGLNENLLWLQDSAFHMPFLSDTPKLILFLDFSTKSTDAKTIRALEDILEDLRVIQRRNFSVAVVQTH